ncbi:biogenesis of lysosome-related organelles complex 1 subunit 2 isoform X2 [Salvelinus sp. IW2-2015]|uniref:biogenesis of lysosome-related organelles complex 1 subunit 2 isoform X2 n=1 Tax=Salvelinus sp. IW2-2015 TaxID=2691554 RepID=UPI000CDF976A|nr:biogenesis of lysosome-related organelles complex 1 subunit 2 isoform X2 [Salvelinus alpinus]
MAATGEEAAEMDCISRVSLAHPTVLSLGGSSEPRGEPGETASEGLEVVTAAPKKPINSSTCEDYHLLENMNKLTSLKYMEMKDISINISRNLQDLNHKYASLQPYLDQINQIEEQVSSLEQAAYKLDTYSKKLEAKFKKLEKR